MIGLIYAFITALFGAFKGVVSKKNLQRMDPYVATFASIYYALPFLLILLFFIDIPPLGPEFWTALIVMGSLNIVARVMSMRALQLADLSLVSPLITLTPLFLLITSPVIIGEMPTKLGIFGVLFIVLGSYLLNIKKRSDGFLAPFKALIKNRGAQLMILVAFIFSITSTYDKIGVQNSSPLFWSVAAYVFMAVFLLPIMLYKSKQSAQLHNSFKTLFPLGFFNAGIIVFQMLAISTTLVAYVISIKRTSVLISVFFGYLFFKEKGLKERLLGASIMVIGVLLITLG